MNLSRGWFGLLLASLALNFFGAGFIVSNWVFKVGVDTPAATATNATGQVAQSHSSLVKKIVDTHGNAITPRVKDMRAANVAVTQALNAEPFDATMFAKVLSELRIRTVESQKAMHDALVIEAVSMSRDQRKQLADVSKTTPERLLLGY